MRLAEVDIYDPDAYVVGVPHAQFSLLRAEAPVFFQTLPDDRGFWILTRHADVMQASADPATFSAARGGIVIEDPDPATLAMLRTQLLSMDPPEHRRMRRSVMEGLTPGRVGAMEPWLRARTRAVMERAAANPECDFVAALAGALPLQVICELMGVPEADRAQVAAWGDRIIGRDDPEHAGDGQSASDVATALGAYGFELANARKGRGGRDLVSVLLDAEIEGEPVNAVEFAGLFVQIIVAGNETTRSLLAGGMLALLAHPDAYAALEADPAAIPRAVEEMLRWVTPVHYFRRTATCDVELRGQKIREGDRVVLSYTSANRDEAVFDAADRFDIAREPNPHLAFGWAEHFCLGAKLARLEARIFFEEFFRHFSQLELVGTPRRLRSNLNNAYSAIPVRLTPR